MHTHFLRLILSTITKLIFSARHGEELYALNICIPATSLRKAKWCLLLTLARDPSLLNACTHVILKPWSSLGTQPVHQFLPITTSLLPRKFLRSKMHVGAVDKGSSAWGKLQRMNDACRNTTSNVWAHGYWSSITAKQKSRVQKRKKRMGTFCCTLLKGINMFIHQNTHFSHFHKIKHMNPPSTPRQEVTLLNDQKQNGTHKKMMMCGGGCYFVQVRSAWAIVALGRGRRGCLSMKV